MNKRFTAIFLFISVFLFWSEPAVAQCSMCRAVVESNHTGAAEGLNNGILYLMGFPYIIMIVLGVLLFRKLYKDRMQFEAADR